MPCTFTYEHAKEGDNMHKHTCKIELRFVLQLHTCYKFQWLFISISMQAEDTYYAWKNYVVSYTMNWDNYQWKLV